MLTQVFDSAVFDTELFGGEAGLFAFDAFDDLVFDVAKSSALSAFVGGAWQAGELMRWSGSGWVAASLVRWNGSTWA